LDPLATSSLTGQIAGGWRTEPDLFARVFPMDLRPQAHETMRASLFAAVVRADAEHGTPPWRHAVVSGRVNDEPRTKLEVTLGAPVPARLLDRYGADAVRYWAASVSPGTDIWFATEPMGRGRKLAAKPLNLGAFVLGASATAAVGEPPGAAGAHVTEPVDRALLSELTWWRRTTAPPMTQGPPRYGPAGSRSSRGRDAPAPYGPRSPAARTPPTPACRAPRRH
jgi:valyl-tRNA synthetase